MRGSDQRGRSWPLGGLEAQRAHGVDAHGAVLVDAQHRQLDALAEAAAERSRWEFLLTAAPLPMVRGTGSPINPIALF